MSLLSDRDLCQALSDEQLIVDPFDPMLLQPASIDLRLSDQFILGDGRGRLVDPEYPPKRTTVRVEDRYVMNPNEFILASTMERISLAAPLAARLEGKSTLGRLGLLVHVSAGFIDPGFRGTITLELKNLSESPILLRPGMRIGQLSVFRMSSQPDKSYGHPSLGSSYQDQDGPVAPAALR